MKHLVLFLAGVVALAGLTGCAVTSDPDGKYILPPQSLIKVVKDGKNYSLIMPGTDPANAVPLTIVSENEYTCKTPEDPNTRVVFVRNQEGQVVQIAITQKGETRTADKMAAK